MSKTATLTDRLTQDRHDADAELRTLAAGKYHPDPDTLAVLLDAAGRDTEWFAGERERCQRREQLRPQAALLVGAQKAEAKAREALTEHDARTQRDIETRAAERARLAAGYAQAQAERQSAERAMIELATLDDLDDDADLDLDLVTLTSGGRVVSPSDPGAPSRYVSEDIITRETHRRTDIRRAHHAERFEQWRTDAHKAEAMAPRNFLGRAIDAKIPTKPEPAEWGILAALDRAERDRLAEAGRREREKRERMG